MKTIKVVLNIAGNTLVFILTLFMLFMTPLLVFASVECAHDQNIPHNQVFWVLASFLTFLMGGAAWALVPHIKRLFSNTESLGSRKRPVVWPGVDRSIHGNN